MDVARTDGIGAAGSEPRGVSVTIPVGTSLAEADKQIILATLEQCHGVKTRAAALLGISVKTLYNRLNAYAAELGS